MTTIYLVAVFWSTRGFYHYETYDTAKEACIETKRNSLKEVAFKAVINDDGRIIFMTPLKCKVSIEVKP